MLWIFGFERAIADDTVCELGCSRDDMVVDIETNGTFRNSFSTEENHR
jgi:hypothetical protein